MQIVKQNLSVLTVQYLQTTGVSFANQFFICTVHASYKKIPSKIQENAKQDKKKSLNIVMTKSE